MQPTNCDHQAAQIVEQEGGSAGKKNILDLAREVYGGYDFDGHKPTGDKLTRAKPLARASERGDIKVLDAGWNQMYLDEIESFPGGKYDDMVDATSGAYSIVTLEGTHNGWSF